MLVKLLLVYKKGLKVFMLCSQSRELIFGSCWTTTFVETSIVANLGHDFKSVSLLGIVFILYTSIDDNI